MREFKLRAFDKTNKEMTYDVSIVGRHIIFEHNSHGYDLDELELTYLDTLDGENEYEIMQCTGLKDKNGKEIYEGDIVTYLDGNEWSTESGYDCEEFLNIGVINFDTEYARFDVTNKESADYEEIFEGGGDFEVIGNIYENPELLEDK